MTPTMTDTTSAQVMTEDELWSDYLAAREFADECRRMYDETWCAYIRSGMKDATKGAEWDQLSAMWRAARERATALYETWTRTAYPLYGIPLPEDESSSQSDEGGQ